MKTRNCDECAHFSVIEDGPRLKICTIGHKPRFYNAKRGVMGFIIGDFGWRRRCDDFDAVVTVEIKMTK